MSTTDPLLARLNPSVKLLLFTGVSLGLLLIFDPWTPLGLYVLMLTVALFGARVPVRTLLLAQIPFLFFGSGTFIVNALTRSGDLLFSLGPLDVTDDGVAIGTSLAMRTLVIGVGVIAFLRTTTPPELLSSMRQQLRLPTRISYALVAGYRVLGGLPDQWAALRRAHAVRRPDPRVATTGKLPLTPALAWRATRSMLVVSLRRGERLAITMETRGLGAGPRTVWKPTPVTRLDGVFAVVAVLAVAVVVGISLATGLYSGPAALMR